MGNEKYLNYYIEVMTSTLTDCVVRNVSMQANAKITEEIVEEQNKKLQELTASLNDYQEALEELKRVTSESESSQVKDLNTRIQNYEKDVAQLNAVINELNNKYRDYDSIKNQATHVDTFKEELIRARQESGNIRSELEARITQIVAENNGKFSTLNQDYENRINEMKQQYENRINELNQQYENEKSELNAKIDYLQLPPAKRKKIDDLNKSEVPSPLATLVNIEGPIKDGGTF